MKLARGDTLRRRDREWILATFTDRYTLDHTPAWADALRRAGEYPRPLYISDAEWLRRTWFFVRDDKRTVDRRFNQLGKGRVKYVKKRQIEVEL